MVRLGANFFKKTGALVFDIFTVCDYSVTKDGHVGYGRLYAAEIETLVTLPESEIVETKLFKQLPQNLTYPIIQPALLARYLNAR